MSVPSTVQQAQAKVEDCKDSFAMMSWEDSTGSPGPGHAHPGSDSSALLHSICGCKCSVLSTSCAHLQGA